MSGSQFSTTEIAKSEPERFLGRKQSKLDLQSVSCNHIDDALQIKKTTAFEAALSETGFGKFQWLALLITGLSYMATGFQNGVGAYIIPAANCDLNLSSKQKGLLNAAFVIGGLSSSFFWGLLADQVGRKRILVFSLVLDSAVTLSSGFSQSFVQLATFRYFNGFIIGGPGSLVNTYLGELIGEKQRPKFLCLLGMFWTISWLLLPIIGFAILPMQWRIQSEGFIFNSWRLYLALFSIPTLVSALLIAIFFPESPKYLYSTGRETEALNVMTQIYHFNYADKNGPFPVSDIWPESTEGAPSRRSIILDPADLAQVQKNLTGKSPFVVLSGVWNQTRCLFGPDNLTATLLSSTLLFCNLFGYYGLCMWLPELFERFENHHRISEQSIAVCELTRLSNNASLHMAEGNDCANSTINLSVFINTFIIGICCLIGNILSSLLADKIGLRILAVSTMLIAGASAGAIYFQQSSMAILVVSCIFQTFVGVANIVITSAACEIFPTRVRALGVCTAIFSGRLGAVCSNLIMGFVLDTNCEVPVLLMSAMLIFGGFIGLLLPKDIRER